MAAAPRILVTGAGGFVGRRLAPRLIEWAGAGSRLVAIGQTSGGPEGFETMVADVSDEAAIDAIVAEVCPDIVVHLAAQSSVGAAHAAAAQTWRTNCFGALALGSACARRTPEATILFASSAEVYGASFNEGPVDEETPLRPQNPYARSKAVAEQIFADVLDPQNCLVIARPFNHSGPGQDERFVLPSFAVQVARIEAGLQEPIMYVGNLEATRDFLHVDDVCDAYIQLLSANLPPRITFNIASGAGARIADMLEMLRETSNVAFEVRVDPARMRPSDIPVAKGNARALNAATGWSPRRSLQEMLADVLCDARRRVTERARS